MNIYYVNANAQPTGEHEVHTQSCTHGATFLNRRDLGYQLDGRFAVQAARNYYQNVDGCMYCCPEAHTR